MKVVFTKPVERVAQLGEEKDVKAGYARNFLFPHRWAVLSTDPVAKTLRVAYREHAQKAAVQKKLIAELAQGWRGKTFTLRARAGEDGTLYGSVSLKEIRKLLGRDDLDFEAPILKTVGRHSIDLKFVDGTTVPVTIVVEAEARQKTG